MLGLWGSQSISVYRVYFAHHTLMNAVQCSEEARLRLPRVPCKRVELQTAFDFSARYDATKGR